MLELMKLQSKYQWGIVINLDVTGNTYDLRLLPLLCEDESTAYFHIQSAMYDTDIYECEHRKICTKISSPFMLVRTTFEGEPSKPFATPQQLSEYPIKFVILENYYANPTV